MKKINANEITAQVADLCIQANIHPNPTVKATLCQAFQDETSPLAQTALGMIVENMAVAQRENMPMCQDTGMVIAFVDIGQEVYVAGNLAEAIHEGVRQGYKQGYLRASVVADPLARTNTGDNTPAVIHYNIVPGDQLKITIKPKGFGSENKSALKMLNPSDGRQGVVDFVVDTVRAAGSSPCPPIVLGIGVGGSMEKSAILAKQALLLDIKEHHPDPAWAAMEAEILEKVNALNIGAAGFKGITTALGARILTHPTHIAGLPVAVNIDCHVTRSKTAII